ncbi:MAG: PilN domain-containing protein [Elusimicrobiota bacterium]
MIRINLVPQEILDKMRRKELILQAAAGGVLFILFLAAVSFTQYIGLRRIQSQVAQNTERLKKLQVLVSEVEDLEKTEGAIRARLNVISGLLKNRPLYPYFMSDFARAVPQGVQVQNLTTSGGGAAGSSLKISMGGAARSNEDIAAWIRNMGDSGRFSAVTLGAVTAQDSPLGNFFSFTLNAEYAPSL